MSGFVGQQLVAPCRSLELACRSLELVEGSTETPGSSEVKLSEFFGVRVEVGFSHEGLGGGSLDVEGRGMKEGVEGRGLKGVEGRRFNGVGGSVCEVLTS